MISYEPLRKQMKEKGITLLRLAELMGISQPSLSSILRNNSNVDSVLKIAEVLNCNVSDIIEWKPGVREKKEKVDISKYHIKWDRLNALIAEKKLSLTKLSVVSGLGENTLVQAKNRNGTVKKATVDAMTAVLGCSVSDIAELLE